MSGNEKGYSGMLDFFERTDNKWTPPVLSDDEVRKIREEYFQAGKLEEDCLVIMRTEPYIDTLFIHYDSVCNSLLGYTKRFTFHEEYLWSYEEEVFFTDRCLKNEKLCFDYAAIDRIFDYYSKKYPDWKLKRYYTKSMRVLDHVYHCMRKGSGKEILYKAGLEELAVNIDEMDEMNLIAVKPSDIYDGISIRTLRALNCKEGAILLETEYNRKFVKELQMKFPGIFKEKLNDAQCRYLNFLINGELTVGEAGRLFSARMLKLMCIWSLSQFNLFVWKEKMYETTVKDAEAITKLDPIYRDYIGKCDLSEGEVLQNKLQDLRFYLLQQRERYNKAFRCSNRKRNQDWQERNKGYVVRFPQTINDFCRESIYMSNCLLTYVDAYINNDTTILFMRKTDDFNAPFITIEIFGNKLIQAYHRFNEDCSKEESEWILDYCNRHGIERGSFTFNNDVDNLF